jgi:hypothetical protein
MAASSDDPRHRQQPTLEIINAQAPDTELSCPDCGGMARPPALECGESGQTFCQCDVGLDIASPAKSVISTQALVSRTTSPQDCSMSNLCLPSPALPLQETASRSKDSTGYQQNTAEISTYFDSEEWLRERNIPVQSIETEHVAGSVREPVISVSKHRRTGRRSAPLAEADACRQVLRPRHGGQVRRAGIAASRLRNAQSQSAAQHITELFVQKDHCAPC